MYEKQGRNKSNALSLVFYSTQCAFDISVVVFSFHNRRFILRLGGHGMNHNNYTHRASKLVLLRLKNKCNLYPSILDSLEQNWLISHMWCLPSFQLLIGQVESRNWIWCLWTADALSNYICKNPNECSSIHFLFLSGVTAINHVSRHD